MDVVASLSDRLHGWAKGWVVLSAIPPFLLVVTLPVADPDLISASLDGRLAYSPEEAFAAIDGYGDAERTQMVWIHALDLVLLAVYTAMFCLTTSWLFQRGFGPESWMRRLNVVPILGGCLDLMENVWVVTLILAYPARPAPVAWLASIATTGKYLSGIPILMLLLAGLVRAAMNRFRVQDTGS